MPRTRHIALIVAAALVAASFSAAGCTRAKTPAPSSTVNAAAAPKPGASSTPSAPSSATSGTAIAPADTLQPPDYSGYERLPVFTYHHVDPKLKNDITLTPAAFEAQLKVLKDGGYHAITARQLYEHQRNGSALPDKPVMITFDDGWRNQFTYAAPLLKKYGFTATYFINPQPIASGYQAYMTADMVKTLAQDGNDVESHTWRHLKLIRSRDVSAASFQAANMSQLKLATDWIRRVVGVQPVALCYPFGYYDLEAIGMAQKAGYALGFTTDEGVADARPWDALAMKRFTVQRSDSLDRFKARLDSEPMPITDIQPAPGARVIGISTTVTVDVTNVPEEVQGFTLTSGPSLKNVKIVERGGRRYAEGRIAKGRVGLRVVVARGKDASGRVYVSSWVIVLGNPAP